MFREALDVQLVDDGVRLVPGLATYSPVERLGIGVQHAERRPAGIASGLHCGTPIESHAPRGALEASDIQVK